MAGTAEGFLEKQRSSFVLYDATKFDTLINEIAAVTQELTSFTTRQHMAAMQYRISSAMQLAAS